MNYLKSVDISSMSPVIETSIVTSYSRQSELDGTELTYMRYKLNLQARESKKQYNEVRYQ